MKLWDKGTNTDKWMEQFTIGKDKELDLALARFDILGTIAHIKMLTTIALLSTDELTLLEKELKNIYQEVLKGNFIIEEGVEDVHSQVELMLTRSLGDVGKKVHSGRSRNDQVLVDLKLYLRDEVEKITTAITPLFDTLIALSNTHKEVLIPGYTHLQIAMPSSFGLWFGAYAESLTDDLIVLEAAHQIVNQNPLGSGAGYGSSFPLNRQMTTDLLGFERLNYNVVYAQMGRGKSEKIMGYAIASIAATLAKMAMDICLYISQNFGFISFPDHLTTGSSIMPHKKNPDVFELIRAKCNKLQALPNDITMITTNLPSGYHRDLQIIKELIVPACDELKTCLEVSTFMLEHIIIHKDVINDPKYTYIFSVESVNEEVLKGMPFRDAYKKVGKDIHEGTFAPTKEVHHTHEGSIGQLCHQEIITKKETIMARFGFEKIHQAFSQLLT